LICFKEVYGKAIDLKEKQEQYEQIENIVNNLTKKDLLEVIKLSDILYKSKDEIFEMLEYLNVVLLKMSKTNYQYTNCIKVVENTKKRLNQNANYDMSIDNMVFNMWEEMN